MPRLSGGLAVALLKEQAGSNPAGLVRAAQAGNREAFGALYEQFGGYVYAILVARLPADEAADLVQEVFLHALERIVGLREPAAFATWIATIARNLATDGLRRKTATDTSEAAGDHYASSDMPPDVQVDAARALAAIHRLPDAYRETLVLRFVQGLTGPEIAEVTGLTPASVRVNLHRGFKLLRAQLGLAP